MPRLLWGGVLVFATWLLFFEGLSSLPFDSRGEPREAVQVLDEVHRGQWILPLRNGVEMPSKPPLFHWLAGLSALMHGRVDELSVRFPSALLATFTILVVFAVASRKWGTEAGVYAAFVLATSFEWIRAARLARVDMTLAACLTVSFVSLEGIARRPRPSPALLAIFYASVGLAVLAKGPVAIVLPVLVALVYLGLTGDLARLREMRPSLGLALALLAPACWYAAAIHKGGQAFLDKQLLKENVLRFLGTGSMTSSHPHPFYYYAPGFLAGFAPWSPFLAPFALDAFRQRRELREREWLYPLVWFVVVFTFYSVASGKRAVYILPVYPAAALLAGAWWASLGKKGPSVSRTFRIVVQLSTMVAVATATIVVLAAVGQTWSLQPVERLAPLLHARDRANLPLAMPALSAHFPKVRLWATVTASAAFLVAAALYRRSPRFVFVGFATLAASTTMLVNSTIVPILAQRRSVKPFVEKTHEVVGSPGRLVFYKMFDYGVVFYAGRHIPVIEALPPAGQRGQRPLYLVLWESEAEHLPLRAKHRLSVVLRSKETPRREDHLLLARISSFARDPANPVTESIPPPDKACAKVAAEGVPPAAELFEPARVSVARQPLRCVPTMRAVPPRTGSP